MADDYYVASASGSELTSGDLSDYSNQMKRSTRVLSKFNEEQRRTAFESIRSSTLVIAGANLIYKGISSILGKLQRTIQKFTLAPMMEGLNEYTSQLTNFQAIVQNSAQFFDNPGSVEHIEAITEALDELNEYADKTIYKFSDMINAVQGFVSAGLTVADAATMTKGLASLTAFMGKGASQYASVTYMVNQAMQRGKMQWYQWRSLEASSGVGGYMAKKLMIETAKAMGKDAPEWDELANIYNMLGGEEADNSFAESLQDDWLTADVLLEAMKLLNQEYSEAELKAKGYSKEIIDMAKNAFEQANKVRTYGQFMDAVIESIGTGWGRIFRSLFGNVSQATDMWTGLMNKITDDIGEMTDALQDQAEIFEKLGGRENIQKIIENIWTIIKKIGKSGGKLFGKLIPRGLGQTLYDISEAVVRITDVLAGNEKPASRFERILVGIGNAMSFIFGLAGRLMAVAKKLWNATSPIWDGVERLVTRFGPQLGTLLDNAVTAIETIADKLANSGLFKSLGLLFTGVSGSIDEGLSGGGIFGFLMELLNSLSQMFQGVNLDGILGALLNVVNAFVGMFDGTKESLSSVGDFVRFIIVLGLAVSLMKPVFRNIAKIAKEFNDVDHVFLKIVGSVIAIVFALQMMSQIKSDKLWSLVGKSMMLAIVVGYLSKAMSKAAQAAQDSWKLIPVLLLIAGLASAAIYGLKKAQEAGVDLDQMLEALKVITQLLKALALIIASIGVLLMAISLKQYINARYGKKALALAQEKSDILNKIVSKETWKIQTQNSLDVNFVNKVVQYILGFSAAIFSLGYAISKITESVKTLGEMNPEQLKQGIKYISIIAGILAGFLVAFGILGKLQGKDVRKFSNGINIRKGETQKVSGGEISKQNGIGSYIAAIIAITASIAVLAKVMESLGTKDPTVLDQGLTILVDIVSIILGIMFLLQKLSDSGSIDAKAIISFVAIAGMMSIAITALSGLALVLGVLTTFADMDKVNETIWNLLLLAGGMGLVMFALSKIPVSSLGSVAASVPLMVLLIGALSLMLLSLSLIDKDFKVSKIWHLVGILSTLVVIVGILAVIFGATGGIGAAFTYLAVGVILALAGALLIVAVSVKKFAEAIDIGARAFNQFISTLFKLNELDMTHFIGQMALLTTALRTSLPTFAQFMGTMSRFQGNLLFSAGSMTVTTTSVSAGSIVSADGAVLQGGNGVVGGSNTKETLNKARDFLWDMTFGAQGQGIIKWITGTKDFFKDLGAAFKYTGEESTSTDPSSIFDSSAAFKELDIGTSYQNKYSDLVNGLTGEQLGNNTANDIYNKLAELEAIYRNGGFNQDPAKLAAAVESALEGMQVNLDGVPVGAFVNKVLGYEYSGESYADSTPISTDVIKDANFSYKDYAKSKWANR